MTKKEFEKRAMTKLAELNVELFMLGYKHKFDEHELNWLIQTDNMVRTYIKKFDIKNAVKYIKILINIINEWHKGNYDIIWQYIV
jgi:hypothetical protein